MEDVKEVEVEDTALPLRALVGEDCRNATFAVLAAFEVATCALFCASAGNVGPVLNIPKDGPIVAVGLTVEGFKNICVAFDACNR